MENEMLKEDVKETTKKRGRPKKDMLSIESKEGDSVESLNEKVKFLSAKIDALLKENEKKIEQKGPNGEPYIYAIDPAYRRQIEREKTHLRRKEYKKERSWEEVKPGGKKVKVTQVYYQYPDGTTEQGNKYTKYIGRATHKEQTIKLKDL